MAARRNPTRLNLLTVRQVQTAGDGDHNDGGGLNLRVRGASAAWVLRFTSPSGKRREMGLGICDRNNATIAGKSLAGARQLAHDARGLLQQSIDPIDTREAKRAALRAEAEERKSTAAREELTLARAARQYHARDVEPNRTDRHSKLWIASLENHVPEALWHRPISAITAPELLDFIAELRNRIPETAERVRQRLEVVFDDAEFRGLSIGNPARAIRRKLTQTRGQRGSEGFAALDYKEAPAFMRALRECKGIAARALEFGMLTASRTGEIIGATWIEFDLDAAQWTIPAARMKGGEQHVVHLVPRAVEILQEMRTLGQPNVFPSIALTSKPLSNMAMLQLLKRMGMQSRTTVHGLCRATFSTWANDTAAARPDVIEAALAHREADRVKAAYNRAEFHAERRALPRHRRGASAGAATRGSDRAWRPPLPCRSHEVRALLVVRAGAGCVLARAWLVTLRRSTAVCAPLDCRSLRESR